MARVFFIQQNFSVGDIANNEQRLIAGAAQAHAAGAAVAVSSELSLTGYLPSDLLYDFNFKQAVADSLQRIVAAAPPGIALLVGLPWWEENEDGEADLYNAYALIRQQQVEGIHRKTRMPNGSVFDEKRYFSEQPSEPLLFIAADETYAVQLCEEMWYETQAQRIAAARIDGRAIQHTIVPNGSPFYVGKQAERHAAAANFARHSQTTVYYAHAAGGQDELVFDGASFVMDSSGKLVGQLPAFTECNAFAEDEVIPYPQDLPAIYAALQCGLRDYVHKCGFENVVLGLSGGVDSALVATLAADALGAKHVTGVMMATEYTSAESLEYAEALAKQLGIRYLQLPLSDSVQAVNNTIAPHLNKKSQSTHGDVTLENIQARLRGLLLMGLSNHHGWMLLATGNKSEVAYGYSTLYGDTNGGFAPIKDVLKTQVWELCRYRNQQAAQPLIPTEIIDRPPSAELRPNQTDQDSLPAYEEVDALITAHLERQPPAAMKARFDVAVLSDFYRRLRASEYKRQQSPVGTKISRCAFGSDWRMPIANRFSL